MMRAGKLFHRITIERLVDGRDDYGVPVPANMMPSVIVRLRAEILNPAREEFFRAYGQTEEQAIVFRTRYVAGITTGDMINLNGRRFDIKEVAEIGRRKGLELRAVARAGQ